MTWLTAVAPKLWLISSLFLAKMLFVVFSQSPVLVVWVLVLALQVLNDVLEQAPLLNLLLTMQGPQMGKKLFQPGLVLTQPGGEGQAEQAWLDLET